MEEIRIKDFEHFLKIVNSIRYDEDAIILYRGQTQDLSLLPSIARLDNRVDTGQMEIEMLSELKRRSNYLVNKTIRNDWEWLVFAQHYGMKTRLLDWTSNPLTALWFACSKLRRSDAYVYILSVDETFVADTKQSQPLQQARTRIYRPILNNERIIAQSGWFTVHMYTTRTRMFVPLEHNSKTKDKLVKIIVPKEIKRDVLKKLSVFGINNQTLYPDMSGICQHLNWSYNV